MKFILQIAFLGIFIPLVAGVTPNAISPDLKNPESVTSRVKATKFDRSNPAAEGISPAAVVAAVERWNELNNGNKVSSLNSIHGFMLICNGKVVAEGFWKPFRREVPHQLFSGTKSFIATAVAFALQEKLLTLDTKIIDIFPEELPEKVSENLAALRIRDLLSMQSGFRGESSRIMAEAANPVKGFFGLDFKFKPGTEFWYDSGVSNMLSIIITKLTGQSAEAYLKSRLFEPLGIGEYSWEKDKFGNSMGGWGIAMTLEDYAKLGQLYLNGGVWNGKRLLSAEWCKQATTLQTEPDVIDRKISYGYHFRVGPEKAYHLAGMFGQFVWVFPEHNMILAIFGGNLFGPMDDKDPIWHILLPALGGEVVPENFGKNIVEKSVENLDFRRSFDTGEPLIFAPGSKVELSFEDSGKVKKINITIEQSACTVSDDGLMQRYPRGAWGRGDDSEKRDDGMNAGEVWNRAFWPASDTLLLDQLRIDGPGQLMNKIKFSQDGVAEIERIEWYDEPLKIMGRWKAY